MDDAASSTNGSSSPPNYQNVSDEDYNAQHRLPEILQDVLAEVLKEKPARPIRAIIDRLRRVYLPAETERAECEQFYGVKVAPPRLPGRESSEEDQLSTGRGLFVRKRQRNSVVIPRLDPLVVEIADLGIHLSQSAAVEEEAKRARAGFREVPTMEAVDCSDFPPKSPEVEAMLEGLLALNPLFKRLERSERKLVYRAFFECRYAAGEIIMREGDIGDVFYILVGGQCHTAGESPDHVLRYQPGDSFGELALIYGTARPSTVVATTDCVLWGLQRNAYRQTLQGITSAHREKYLTFLKRFPLLSGLRNDHLRLIADCLESVEFDEGQSIIRQGDAGEEFFLVLSGEVEVRKREADSEREVGILKEGDYFGEIALLTDLPRQASCIARGGPVSCAMLRREDFLRVLPEETTSKMCEEFLPKIQQAPPPK